MGIRWGPLALVPTKGDDDWQPPEGWVDFTALWLYPPETTLALCPGRNPVDPFTGALDPTVDRMWCGNEWLIGWERGQSAVSLKCTEPWCGWEGMWFRPPTSARGRVRRLYASWSRRRAAR